MNSQDISCHSVRLVLFTFVGILCLFCPGIVLALPDPNPGSFLENLDITGDFRLRYEYNSSYAETPSWDRGVMRARFAAKHDLSDYLGIGARLVTGDPDNPRTTDFAMRDFASDVELSLDRAYVTFEYGNLFLSGGKFAKPFTSTEVAWDGDVNLAGLGGQYELFRNESWSAQFSGAYFTIGQEIFEKGSDMLGGQLSLHFQPDENWDLGLHSAFFDYDIGALSPGAPGGARGNNVTPDGNHFVSDFNLLDTVATVTYKGFGERWNIRFIGDYVRNLGAEAPEDTGYGFDVMIGNLSTPGHLLYRYDYLRVETDAVLGMFSNDNIVLPTNYELHTLSVDYALAAHTFIGLTSYTFRHADRDSDSTPHSNDWFSRVRLNLYFTF